MTCPEQHFSLQKYPLTDAAAPFVYLKWGSPYHSLFSGFDYFLQFVRLGRKAPFIDI